MPLPWSHQTQSWAEELCSTTPGTGEHQRAWEPALFVWLLWQWMLFKAKFSMAVHGDGLTEQQVPHQARLTGLLRLGHAWTGFV